MMCPHCSKHTLEERERDGITLDICQECRGIWMDRGELERLISKANQDLERQMDAHGRKNSQDEHYVKSHEIYQKHHSHDNHGHGDSHHHRRKHWLAELFD